MRMKKILITGISGQDGLYLSSKILSTKPDSLIYGITRTNNTKQIMDRINFLNPKAKLESLKFLNVDFNNYDKVNDLISTFKPDVLFNLSGPSNVNKSIGNTDYYLNYLVGNFENITKSVVSSKLKTKIFQASSSEMFHNSDKALNEHSDMKPRNPYSEAKYDIHNKVSVLRKEEGLNISSGIMFNHESIYRDSSFLIMKIISTALDIKNGLCQKLSIGSLDYKRDWSFAGDMMDAVLLISQQETLNDYVLGSGKSTKVQKIIRHVFSAMNLNWEEFIEIDRHLLREGDPISILSDPSKIYNELGWKTTTDMEEILSTMVEFCINKKVTNYEIKL